MQIATPFIIAASLLASLPAAAILIRPDRDDAEYLELATRYPAAIALPGGGEGVLISGRWVLTAAHRAKALQETKPAAKLRITGRDYEIESIYTHPDWKGGANDIALVLLRKDVAGVIPIPIYRASDESGKAVAVLGHGGDGKARAGINTVDRVDARVLALKIKAADDASDLQGAMTPGDSGGPAILDTGESLYVAGINSRTDGEWELYARASSFATWIDAQMLDVARKEADALLDPERR